MFTVTLTSYGQTQVSDLVQIDGIILLYEYVSDISSISNISSYTQVLDEDSAGNIKNNICNVLISDSSSSEYQAHTILFYKNNSGTKNILGGYSAEEPFIKKSASAVNLWFSFDFSAFTNGFALSAIKAGFANASHNEDGLLHLENPNTTSDDNYSVYNKSQVDALLQDKQSTLSAGDGIAISNGTVKTTGIPFGIVDNTSTATVFTVTVPGIYKLEDGVCCLLKNGVITSASGFTLEVNGLGAKPVYSNMAAATRETTIFNVNYTMLFVYDSTRIEGGAWVCYRGYFSDANSIAYQIRGNVHTLPTTAKFYRYRLLFTSADGTHFVPSNTSTSTNATAKRDVVQTPIDPFGEIVYYSTTTAVEANANPGPTYLWTQYAITFGYSFNRTGAALTLTPFSPVYIKCAPQSDGSAIIDADTPYVQALPNTADGKIYIFLGIASAAVTVELLNNHPIYYHDGTGIRIWHGKDSYSKSELDTIIADYVQTSRTINNKPLTSDITLTLDDISDGTNRSIPTVNNSTITIKKNSSDTGDSFTTNASSGKTINLGLATVATSGSYNDLSDKPTATVINDSTITIKKNSDDTGDSFTTNNATAKTINLGLHTVATSGLYNDLSNKPTIPTVNNAKLTIKKDTNDTGTEFTANASSDVTCNLGLHTVATSGSYNDLSNKPTIPTVNNSTITIKKNSSDTGDSFTTNAASGKTINLGLATVASSGSYNDLSNKPVIPIVPEDVSAFNNDAGYLTSYTETDPTVPSWAKQSSKPSYNLDEIPDGTNRKIPTKVSDLTNDSGFITSYTETDPTVPSWAKAQNKPSYTLDEVTDGSTRKLSNYELKSNLKEGAYVDVDETTMTSSSTNLPTSKAVASYISGLGYITSSSLPTVNNSTITIKKNTNDTGDSFTTNSSSAKTINLGLSTVATSGSYNDLSNKPTIPTVNDATLTIQKNASDTGDTFTANASTDKTINLDLADVASSGSYNDLSNKPTIPTVNNSTITIKKNTNDTGDSFTTNAASGKTINLGLSTVATSGSYNDLSNKPTIPTVNNAKLTIKKNASDTGTEFTANASTDVTCNLNLATVATSGSYNDLSNKPTIPTVNNATLTIQKNGTTVNTFTANASSNVTANITVPTTVAELTDAGNYAQSTSLTSLVATAQYNSTDKTIEFYNASGTKLNTDIDATAFIKDGMVDNVEITSGNLVISFNTDAGKEDIEIPISDIFDASNYYTKSQVDGLIPTVNNAKLTIKKNASDTGTEFTANASSNVTCNLGLATVATSGSYNDLSNKPTIPTVNNAKLTIKKSSTDAGTEFTANASTDVTCNLGLSAVATSGSYNDLSNKPTIPADTGDLTNNAGFITSSDLPTNHVTTDTAQEITGAKTIAEDKLKIGDTTTNEDIDNFVFKRGQEFIVGTQSSATSLWQGATSQSAIYEGMCINYLVPVACTSTAATLELTLPDNTTTGAIPVRRNAANTVTSTHIGVGSVVQLTLLLNRTVGSTTYEKVWKMNESYDSNTNTIAYQLRGNSALLPASDTSRYYKLFFSSADNTKWVPASINSSNNTTTARTANQRPINPFGRIAYTSATTSYTAGTNVAAATLWDQYTINLGYSFGTLSLTPKLPVYIKCTPQSDGSAIIDSTTPVVQSLPSSADNKIYIFLGTAYGTESTTQTIEMFANKPVYYHDGTGIRIWTGVQAPDLSDYVPTSRKVNNKALTSDITLTLDDVADGTNRSIPTVNNSTITIKKNSDDTGDSFTTNASSGKTINLGLSAIATSGSYNDLSNKPTIPTVNDTTITIKKNTSDTGDSFTTNAATTKTINLGLSTVATSGSYNDLSNKPTIPTVNDTTITIKKNTSDTGDSFTTNASTTKTINLGLATVATSGSYNDLSNKPTIPTVNNATLTIQKNGTSVGTFTANASSNATANITVPLESISVDGTTQTITNRNVDLHIPADITNSELIGGFVRYNVSGSGNLTISNTYGLFPYSGGSTTTLPAGTYLVRVRVRSTTASYSITVNFGTPYTVSTTNGVIDDLRSVTLSSAQGFSASITTVAANTYLRVVLYEPGNAVTAIGPAAVTNDYNDLNNIPNGTLIIQKNGSNVASFSASADSNVTANITVPTNTNQLTNGAGFITSSDLPTDYVKLTSSSQQTIQSEIAIKTYNSNGSMADTFTFASNSLLADGQANFGSGTFGSRSAYIYFDTWNNNNDYPSIALCAGNNNNPYNTLVRIDYSNVSGIAVADYLDAGLSSSSDGRLTTVDYVASKYVTINTAQTITGSKTFDKNTNLTLAKDTNTYIYGGNRIPGDDYKYWWTNYDQENLMYTSISISMTEDEQDDTTLKIPINELSLVTPFGKLIVNTTSYDLSIGTTSVTDSLKDLIESGRINTVDEYIFLCFDSSSSNPSSITGVVICAELHTTSEKLMFFIPSDDLELIDYTYNQGQGAYFIVNNSGSYSFSNDYNFNYRIIAKTSIKDYVDNKIESRIDQGVYYASSAGSATNARYVYVSRSSSSYSYPLVFTEYATAGGTLSANNKSLYTDTVNSVYYNPSTNTLTCPTFSGNLTGNADTATSATYASNIGTNSTNAVATYTYTNATTRALIPAVNYSSSAYVNLGNTSTKWGYIYGTHLGNSSNYFTSAYITTINGTTFTGTASKATADASGNTITSYYCTLSTDQSITGVKHITPTGYNYSFDIGQLETVTGSLKEATIQPVSDGYCFIGTSSKKFKAVHAITFYGELSGNASSAGYAQKLSTGTTDYIVYTSSPASMLTCAYRLCPSTDYGQSLGYYNSTADNCRRWNYLYCKYIGSSSSYVTSAYITNMYGTASKATADASGNTITSYYCTLSTDQTISGTKTFSGTTKATGNVYISGYNSGGLRFADSDDLQTTDYVRVRGNCSSASYSGIDLQFYVNSALKHTLCLKDDGSDLTITSSTNACTLGSSSAKIKAIYASTYYGLAEQLYGTGVGAIYLLAAAIAATSSSSVTFARGDILQSKTGCNVNSICYASPNCITSITTPTSSTAANLRNMIGSTVSGTFRILSRLVIYGDTNQWYVLLAIRTA